MLLSIIIPSYNHDRFVLSTIQAAASIDIQDKEIIVIDDGSRDGSVSVIRDYIAARGTDTNIQLIARENRGLVKTLNQGLSLAKGKYFYLIASDDIPIPEGITALVEKLETNSNLQFVLGNALVMQSEQQGELLPAYREAHTRFFAMPHKVRQKEMFMNYPNPMLLQATVFKTSALNAIGGWREDIMVDDFSLFLRMFLRLSEVGKDYAFHPEIMTCFYRQHQTNSFKNRGRQFMMVEQALAKLCPTEWRDDVLFRNFAAYCLGALRNGEILLAARFLRSTIGQLGLVRCLMICPCRAVVRRLAG